MDITNILDSLGGFIGGGVLTFIATWKYSRKEAEATAMEKVQGIYQKLTEDLVTEIERLKDEVELLRKEVSELSHRSSLACYRHICPQRIFEEENQIIEFIQDEDNTEQSERRLPER